MDRDCLFCGSKFKVERKTRLFCQNACKTAYNRENRLRCFYCGSLAASRDHITPVSTSGKPRGFECDELVNSCLDCNYRMNDLYPYSLISRVEHLALSIYKQFKLDSAVPQWNDEEIEELGQSLRQAVKAKIEERKIATERYLHIKGVLLKLNRFESK